MSRKAAYLSRVLCCIRGAFIALLALSSLEARSQTIRHVGPGQQYATITAAAAAAQSGDIVEIQAGQYVGDVATWLQSKLTIRAVNGRARLVASGISAEGKAIWVIRNGNFTIQDIDFTGATVPDHNGAGIRFENGSLLIQNCSFLHNEEGILTGGGGVSTLSIQNSEFGYNGYGDGYTHNLYVGQIAKLSVTGSYFHHAKVGHLLKSRAKENQIFYNRLTDETGGTASYEVDLPNGGLAYLVGNIIEQSATTQNSNIIAYGEEGYYWPANQIYLVNNTIVNDRTAGGTFLKVAPGAQVIKAFNNIRYGTGSLLESAGTGQYQGNVLAGLNDLESPSTYDYRLRSTSLLVGKVVAPGTANYLSLLPTLEYLHPRQTRAISTATRYSPGALQTLGP